MKIFKIYIFLYLILCTTSCRKELDRTNPLDSKETGTNNNTGIKFHSFEVFSDNNDDEKINKGESVALKVTLRNNGASKVNKLRASITCNSSYVSNLKNGGPQSYLGSGYYDYVSPNALAHITNTLNYLNFDVSNTTPAGTIITFDINMVDESGNTWTDSFNVTVN